MSRSKAERARAFSSRRRLLASFAAMPLAGWVGCAAGDAEESEATAQAAVAKSALEERYTRRAGEFVAAFNAHDLDRALAFFSDDAMLLLNERGLADRERIRQFLLEYGAAGQGSGLSGAQLEQHASYFLDDEALLFEGVLHGTRVGELSGYAANGMPAMIPFAFLCSFDAEDRCDHCEVVLDWGELLPTVS